MNLNQIKKILKEKGCQRIYVKRLSPNDNSKNQVYFGGSFDILNIFPISEIKSEPKGNWERDRFKASINFSWISEQGNIVPAPHAQLILYPKYPEVRFSGFLKGCTEAPNELMTSRLENRILFLSVTRDHKIIGYSSHGQSESAIELAGLKNLKSHGVFTIIDLYEDQNSRNQLLRELKRINSLGWINSKQLNPDGTTSMCNSSHCGGYTLEAELGITPNGYSKPDFLDWEVKQFSVKHFDRYGAEVITLMTPEPNNGFYRENGLDAFILKYGYPDKLGRPDRFNFGGIHKVGAEHATTHLRLELLGFDAIKSKITDVNGSIALIGKQDEVAASWSFATLLEHWGRKHNRACYVPSQCKRDPGLQYMYGNELLLGEGTDFTYFLQQMHIGNIYYDPGIKIENLSTKPKHKNRSQFRIKARFIDTLYISTETVDLLNFPVD